MFTDEKFNTSKLKKYISKSEFSYIGDLLKTNDLTKNLFVFELSSKKKIVLISIKKNIKTSDIEKLGAELYGRINYGRNSEYLINSESITVKHEYFLGHFLHGLKLKSYEFKKYKSKIDTVVFLGDESIQIGFVLFNDVLGLEAVVVTGLGGKEEKRN